MEPLELQQCDEWIVNHLLSHLLCTSVRFLRGFVSFRSRSLSGGKLAMRDALLEGDLDTFGELMTRHWEANKGMDPGSTNPFIDRLFEQFTPYIVGGKLVGAGGGGFAEVIVKDRGASRELSQMLGRAYPESDVRVWPCRIVERGLVVKGK